MASLEEMMTNKRNSLETLEMAKLKKFRKMYINRANYDSWEKEDKKFYSKMFKNIDTKIKGFSKKHFFNYNDVWKAFETANDIMLAGIYEKDTVRLNYHEKVQLEKLNENNIAQIHHLPKGGKNKIYLENGSLKKEVNDKRIKTLDAKVDLDSIGTIVFSLKYTCWDTGGGEADKINEIKTLLENNKDIESLRKNNLFLVVILDGEYYNIYNEREISELQEKYNNDRVLITNSDSFKDIFPKFLYNKT